MQQAEGLVIYKEAFIGDPVIFTLLATREDVFDVHLTRKQHAEDDEEDWDIIEETEAGSALKRVIRSVFSATEPYNFPGH